MFDKDGKALGDFVFGGYNRGGYPFVMVTAPEIIGTILKDPETYPKGLDNYTLYKEVIGTKGLVVVEGKTWKRDRRLLTPLFHGKTLRDIFDHMKEASLRFVESATVDKEHAAKIFFSDITVTIVVNIAFGRDFDAAWLAERWRTLTEHMIFYIKCKFFLTEFVAKRLPSKRIQNLLKAEKDIQEKIKETCIMRKQKMARGESDTNYDVIDTMLNATDDKGNPIDFETISSQATTFLFAGHDTTTTTLSWAISYIAEHPEVQKKMQKEVDEVLGDESIEYDDFDKLPYIQSVIKETLRLRPVLPFLWRAINKDIDINGTTLKKGTEVGVFWQTAHTSSEYWEDPMAFKPERWMTPKKRHPFQYVPFLAGPRNCIGRRFAMLSMVTILSQILQRYDIIVEDKSYFPGFEVVNVPKGLKFKLSRRMK